MAVTVANSFGSLLQASEQHLDIALQPIVNIHNGRIHGYEALTRNTQKLGIANVLDLLDIAAENGTLEEVNWILQKKAVDKFAKIKRDDEILYLNVDARIFDSDNDHFNDLERRLVHKGLEYSDICIELSEKYQSISNDKFFEKHGRWRGKGIRFAIDDFGQGYSGLRVLYDVTPDVLKIDRFFISEIQSDSKKRLFVTTVVDLAHVLGVKVLAEGVETLEEINVCREIGCDLLQGYYVSKPSVDIEAFEHVYYPVSPAPRQKRDLQTVAAKAIAEAAEDLPTVLETSHVQHVLEIFKSNPASACVPVLDKHGYPRGAVLEKDLRKYLYLPFGKELLINKSCGLTIASLMRSCPTLDVNTDISKFVNLVADGIDVGIIVTQQMKYIGFASASSLVRVANMLHRIDAEDRDPISKLPTRDTVNAFIEDALGVEDAFRTFCYFDINGFKEFNDAYGFRVGDRIIRLFSDLLRKNFGEGWFLGHLGGDDFVAGRVSDERVDISEQITGLQEAFKSDAAGFCVTSAIDCDQKAGRARFSQAGELSCRAGVVVLDPGTSVATPEDLIRKLQAIKDVARLSNKHLTHFSMPQSA